MQEWKYMILGVAVTSGIPHIDFKDGTSYVGTMKVGDFLDKIGAEGYELVAAIPHSQEGTCTGWNLFFKRPKE